MTLEKARLYSTARVTAGLHTGKFVRLLSAEPTNNPYRDNDATVHFTVEFAAGQRSAYHESELDRFVL